MGKDDSHVHHSMVDNQLIMNTIRCGRLSPWTFVKIGDTEITSRWTSPLKNDGCVKRLIIHLDQYCLSLWMGPLSTGGNAFYQMKNSTNLAAFSNRIPNAATTWPIHGLFIIDDFFLLWIITIRSAVIQLSSRPLYMHCHRVQSSTIRNRVGSMIITNSIQWGLWLDITKIFCLYSSLITTSRQLWTETAAPKGTVLTDREDHRTTRQCEGLPVNSIMHHGVHNGDGRHSMKNATKKEAGRDNEPVKGKRITNRPPLVS